MKTPLDAIEMPSFDEVFAGGDSNSYVGPDYMDIDAKASNGEYSAGAVGAAVPSGEAEKIDDLKIGAKIQKSQIFRLKSEDF